MNYIDFTFPTPQENLACDEALLDVCEDGYPEEILRFWEPRDHFVVLGYSNKIQSEVNILSCEAENIPILRRCTGGGTVLQGPGCLNYSLILKIQATGPLEGITAANNFIMTRHRDALAGVLNLPVKVDGYTDLTVNGLKFSGNSQRRKRRCLLFHGSFLLDLDLAKVTKFLHMPTHEPPYRQSRPHAQFLMNLSVPASLIKDSLRKAWGAVDPFTEIPADRIEQLVAGKYTRADWNEKF